MNLIVLAPVGATVALLFAAYFTYTIFKVDEGTDSMKHIAESIRKGANAYLIRQYIAVGKFFAAIFVLLLILSYFDYVSIFIPYAIFVLFILFSIYFFSLSSSFEFTNIKLNPSITNNKETK